MKMLVTICAAVVLTVLATFLVVSNQKAAQFARERELLRTSWDAERSELEAALKAAKHRQPVGSGAALVDPGAARNSAQEILEKLKKTKVLPGDQHNQSVRRIVHELETLVELGPEAI